MPAKLRRLREQLKPLEVEGVEETGRELGRGAYGVVLEMKVHGLRCAGKMLHEMFFSTTSGLEKSSITTRFAEECLRHSKIRHPNIVQLIGIHFAPKSPVPTLIMELMPQSVSQIVENYPNIPSHVKWSILLDVAVGLLFLHSQSPPVIHRDLTANNILLTENMKAKIADLGVARIVDINPSKLTTAPGTPSYMPPEAFIAQPVYNAKLDVFSFGNLIIHISIQVWPIPLVEMHRADPDEPGKFTLVSEIERRADYLIKMKDGHPLKTLTTRCLQNDPRLRPATAEVVKQLEGVAASDPPPFSNSLDMLRELATKSKEVCGLQEKMEELKTISEDQTEKVPQESEKETRPTDTASASADRLSELSSKLETVSSSLHDREEEIDLLQRDLAVKEKLVGSQEQGLAAKEQEVHSAYEQVEACRKQLSAEEEIARSLRKQLSAKDKVAEALSDQNSAKDHTISALRDKTEGATKVVEILQKSRDAIRQQLAPLKESLETKIEEFEIQRERFLIGKKKVDEKATEVAAKDVLLQSKEETIRDLREEVQALRTGGPAQPHVQEPEEGPVEVNVLHPGAILQWDQCANLPSGVWLAQAVQLRSKVYVQGDADTENSQVFSYDHPTDAWVSIEAPTKSAALVVYRSQVSLVGGKDVTTGKATNRLWVMEEDIWTEPLSPMSCVRYGASAISSAEHLIVAGGADDRNRYCDTVEVCDGEKWMRTSLLPLARSYMKSTCHSGNWYLVGGISQYVTIFCASLVALIEKATQPRDSSTQETAWQTLPDVPYLYSTSATFGGALVTVGGKERSGALCSSVHMYSPLTRSWVKVGDVPEALDSTCTVSLTTGEMLVIGGRSEGVGKSRLVFKASLKVQ